MEFPTEEARKKYLEEHPGADPKKHTVQKPKGDSGGRKYKPVPDAMLDVLDNDLPPGVHWDGSDDGSITLSADSRSSERELDRFIAQMQKKFPGLKADDLDPDDPNGLDFRVHMGKPKQGKAPSNSYQKTRVAQRYLDKLACACGDELSAGREHGERGKGYGETGPDVRGPGKWTPDAKGKCYYETGDEKDRCYVTQNGGPGGQKKPGPSTRPGDWKTYEKQRWAAAPRNDTPEPEKALKALQILVDKLELPIRVTELHSIYPVKVPPGFESLFKEIEISVSWERQAFAARVSWAYSHPDGGTNGKFLGFVAYNDGKWGWQTSEPRAYGFID